MVSDERTGVKNKAGNGSAAWCADPAETGRVNGFDGAERSAREAAGDIDAAAVDGTAYDVDADAGNGAAHGVDAAAGDASGSDGDGAPAESDGGEGAGTGRGDVTPGTGSEGSGEGYGFFRKMGKKLSEGTYRTVFGLVLLLIICTKIVFDFEGFRGVIKDGGKMFISLLGYLLVGFVIAYVLNAYVGWLTAHPLKKIKSEKKKRGVGIVIAYVTMAAVLTFLIVTIVPKVVESVSSLAKMVPSLAERVYRFYLDVVEGGRFDLPQVVTDGIVSGIEGVKNWLVGLLSSDVITGYVPRILSATGSGIFKIFMGLLVSVYMLLEKDRALTAAKKITAGLFRSDRAAKIADGGRKIDTIFKQYFAGKLLQGTVILFLAYVVMLIGGINYAILFATVIAITNMIPYIGPWIGGIPTILISLVQDPWMGLRALICVLTIQMLDNWFITPRVVGHKMGISPLLVLILAAFSIAYTFVFLNFCFRQSEQFFSIQGNREYSFTCVQPS